MMSKEIKHDRCGRRRGCGESADGDTLASESESMFQKSNQMKGK